MDERESVKFQIIAGELCLDFINTLDNRPVPERRKELLPAYTDLLDWAVQAGSMTSAHHEAVRCEAASHPKDAAAVHLFNSIHL